MNLQITVLKEVNELTEGASFGELALVLDKPRTATIYTKTPQTTLCMLYKRDYQALIGESFKTRMDRACKELSRFELFTKIRIPRQLFAVSYYVKERQFIRNAWVYRQGDNPMDGIYLVKEGEVEVRWRGDGAGVEGAITSRMPEVVMGVAGEGEAIGVEEVIDGRNERLQGVLVKSERAVLLQISREDFTERVLVLHPEVRKHLIRENEIKK